MREAQQEKQDENRKIPQNPAQKNLAPFSEEVEKILEILNIASSDV